MSEAIGIVDIPGDDNTIIGADLLAQKLKTHVRTIGRMARRGTLPRPNRAGRKPFWTLGALRKFWNSPPPPKPGPWDR